MDVLFPCLGEQYDIGWGQKLFLSCQGQGPPTVVLDAPTGMSSDVWSEVASKLSKLANVSTDRMQCKYILV